MKKNTPKRKKVTPIAKAATAGIATAGIADADLAEEVKEMLGDDEVVPEGTPVVQCSIHLMKMTDGSVQTAVNGEPTLSDLQELLVRSVINFTTNMIADAAADATLKAFRSAGTTKAGGKIIKPGN